MKTVLIALLVLIALAAPATAETIVHVDGWKVVAIPAGEPGGHFYGVPGSYLVFSEGPVYQSQGGGWHYVGMLGTATLPAGFPAVEFVQTSMEMQLIVVPPQPLAAVCDPMMTLAAPAKQKAIVKGR